MHQTWKNGEKRNFLAILAQIGALIFFVKFTSTRC